MNINLIASLWDAKNKKPIILSSVTQSTGDLITEALVFSQKGLSAKYVSSLIIIK